PRQWGILLTSNNGTLTGQENPMRLMSRARRASARPAILPRRIKFAYKGLVDTRYWYDDDPVLTHFMNVLSVTFPDGERFFVDAVRALRDRIDDAERQKEISGFIGQEAMHSLEHKAFNELMANKGYEELEARA